MFLVFSKKNLNSFKIVIEYIFVWQRIGHSGISGLRGHSVQNTKLIHLFYKQNNNYKLDYRVWYIHINSVNR